MNLKVHLSQVDFNDYRVAPDRFIPQGVVHVLSRDTFVHLHLEAEHVIICAYADEEKVRKYCEKQERKVKSALYRALEGQQDDNPTD